MKITLDINERLLMEAMALAAERRTTLTRLIEEGLQLRLRVRVKSAARRRALALPVSAQRGGLVAGVDPLSNRSLHDAADDAA